jgi:hypothetical protein
MSKRRACRSCSFSEAAPIGRNCASGRSSAGNPLSKNTGRAISANQLGSVERSLSRTDLGLARSPRSVDDFGHRRVGRANVLRLSRVRFGGRGPLFIGDRSDSSRGGWRNCRGYERPQGGCRATRSPQCRVHRDRLRDDVCTRGGTESRAFQGGRRYETLCRCGNGRTDAGRRHS